MLCVELCTHNQQYCRYESERHICDLSPYDHLRRFFRVCIAHFKHNLQTLARDIDAKVLTAMYSLASSDAHPCIKTTLQIIQNGGTKARGMILQQLILKRPNIHPAWLKDKETAKFVLPGLYQPFSLIPPYIWKASPATTNGNEQAHRNVNRDGIGLTTCWDYARTPMRPPNHV